MKKPVKYPYVILLGLVFGIFIIMPINELVSYYEYHHDTSLSVWQFVSDQIWKAISLQTPRKFFFYLIIGGLVGGMISFLIHIFRKRNKLLISVNDEMNRDITALIAGGENDNVEFKSSFRFDYKQQKVNKALESVIMKTISGFLNTRGGSLLIGVADNGGIVGLEEDYKTLNRKDNDGYTQLLMTSVADKLGTPVCRLVRILFYVLDQKEICRVIILPSPVPVYTKEDQKSHFYVRTASGTREMGIEEAVTFIRAKWG